MIEQVPQWASRDAGTLPWVAVAGYLLAALLCFWQNRASDVPRERLFWALAGLAMLALGLNKQLDLQTSLTVLARDMARADGWYAQRRAVQAIFVTSVSVAALAVLMWLGWLVRRLRAGVTVSLFGLCLLGLFVLVRAASFHHVDIAMRTPVLGLKLHTVLELAGIAIVALGAMAPRRARAPVHRPGRPA